MFKCAYISDGIHFQCWTLYQWDLYQFMTNKQELHKSWTLIQTMTVRIK